MPEPKRSALSDYMSTYGSRLQSMLHSPVNPGPGAAPGAPAMGPTSGAPAIPGSAMQPSAGTASGEGLSFADLWSRTPEPERKQFVDRLDQTLKKGNQTIDSAYDEMIAKLGTRPSGKLSRQDKAALIMEFGLALMANSARGKYGDDLGGALGASGLQTMDRYQQMTRGRQQAFDAQVGAINAARSKAKSALAEKVATEGVKGDSEIAKAALTERARGNEISGTITSEGGDVYGYTRGGRASALRDVETGQPIKERARPGSEPLVAVLDDDGNEIWVPRSEAAGRRKRPPASTLEKPFGLKAADTNAIYRQAAGLFGGMYDPMTGRIAGLNREQSEIVQRIAARASQIFMEGAGKIDHASAVEQAFEEVRDRPSAREPEERKTIGGKTYVKIDGQWYEDG